MVATQVFEERLYNLLRMYLQLDKKNVECTVKKAGLIFLEKKLFINELRQQIKRSIYGPIVEGITAM